MKRLVLLFIVIVAVLSNTANSQDKKAVEVLESMQEQYEESIEGIDDYVMEKGNHTVFYKKDYTENGRPYFKTKTKGENVEKMESATNEDLYSQFSSQAKEKATYKGDDEVEGHNVHVLYIDKMEIEGFNPNNDTEDTIEDIYLYIDSDKLVLRKMKYTVKSKIQGGRVREVSPIVKNRDFRNVEGLMIPYETSTVVQGLALSEEERKQAKKGLEKFDQMPEDQKKMARQMMGDKIKKYRKMLEEDRYKKVSKVKSIEVNTGMEFEDF